jgi:hypothetical protein
VRGSGAEGTSPAMRISVRQLARDLSGLAD